MQTGWPQSTDRLMLVNRFSPPLRPCAGHRLRNVRIPGSVFLNIRRYRSSHEPHTHEKDNSPRRPPDADAGLRLVQPRHPSRRPESQPRHLPSLHRPLVRQTSRRPPGPRHALAAARSFQNGGLALRLRIRTKAAPRSLRPLRVEPRRLPISNYGTGKT